MTTTKRTRGKVSQEQLMNLYRQQQAAIEADRVAKAQKASIVKAGDMLVDQIQKQRLEVEEGPAKPNITKIVRRVPHYKQETAELAIKAGFDPDEYLEACRNRGGRVTYFRLKMKVVE